ncbi:MAG: HAD hydrolase-like protein [Phycisphaerales bacterium]|nr:HAD hydrolase-like protein [Phycisphaerales bacterium]
MLILYDIDMTLLETRHIGIDCLHDAGRESFSPEFTIEGLNFGGCLDPDIIARMLVMNGLDPSEEHINILRRGYHERLTTAASEREISWALPGAHELVRATRDHPMSFTLGLLTGNFPETGTIKLQRAGFDMNDFEVCVWGDDSPHHPPTRSHLPPVGMQKFRAIKGREINPESVIIVGDTVHDVSCALDSGCTVLAVATGHATAEELRDAGAHRVIEDLTDTEGILSWLTKQWRPFAPANA